MDCLLTGGVVIDAKGARFEQENIPGGSSVRGSVEHQRAVAVALDGSGQPVTIGHKDLNGALVFGPYSEYFHPRSGVYLREGVDIVDGGLGRNCEEISDQGIVPMSAVILLDVNAFRVPVQDLEGLHRAAIRGVNGCARTFQEIEILPN